MRVFIIISLLLISTNCYAVLILNGEHNINNLPIKFPDGSVQSTAVTIVPNGSYIVGPPGPAGASGADGLAGIQGVQGPAGQAAAIPAFSFSSLSTDVNNVWFSDFENWVSLCDASGFPVNQPIIRFNYYDNIGVRDSNWCVLGVFVDEELEPRCVGSYSGASGSITFNNYNLTCLITGLSYGPHSFAVKHKSQNCHYGNSATGDIGQNRFFSIEEIPF